MTFPDPDPTCFQVGDECTLEEITKAHVLLVMWRADGYLDAARILGIQPSTLWRLRVKWGLTAGPKNGDDGDEGRAAAKVSKGP